jgi:hypothetical protein
VHTQDAAERALRGPENAPGVSNQPIQIPTPPQDEKGKKKEEEEEEEDKAPKMPQEVPNCPKDTHDEEE